MNDLDLSIRYPTCTICFDPIEPSSLHEKLDDAHILSCNHQIHFSCFVRWTDALRQETPDLNTLSCPECRHISHIPTPYSTLTILQWAHKGQNGCWAVGVILGMGLGSLIPIKAKHSSFLAELCATNFKQTGIPSIIWFPCMGGIVGFFTCMFVDPYFEKGTQKVATLTYNRLYGTHFTANDVWLGKYFTNESPETLLHRGMQVSVAAQLFYFSTATQDLPFHPDDKKYITALNEELQPWEKKIGYLTIHCLSRLKESSPDVLAQAKRLKGRFLESQGNETFKEELASCLHSYLLPLLKKDCKVVIPDRHVAFRMVLTKVIASFKENTKISNPEKKKQWDALMDGCQRECQEPNSLLVSSLQKKLPTINVLKTPLLHLLFDDGVCDAVSNAFTEIKKQDFEKVGFSMKLNEEDNE